MLLGEFFLTLYSNAEGAYDDYIRHYLYLSENPMVDILNPLLDSIEITISGWYAN